MLLFVIKKPNPDPIPTMADANGPKNIDKNIGTCDANVAVKGPICIAKIQKSEVLQWIKILKEQYILFF